MSAFEATEDQHRLVEIGLDNVEYALREGEGLVIRHETEDVSLTRENPVAIRPVSMS
jgi:alpha,alpha-trehalose phosphorylase